MCWRTPTSCAASSSPTATRTTRARCPYLLKDLDRTVNIYATKLTLGLIEGKFAEHRVKNAKLIEIKPGDEVKLGASRWTSSP